MTFAKQTHRILEFLGKRGQVMQMPHFTFEILQMCFRKIPTYPKSACQSEEGVRNKTSQEERREERGIASTEHGSVPCSEQAWESKENLVVYHSKELLKT